MNKKVFTFNWLYRNQEGWLFGLKFKPAVKTVDSRPNIFVPPNIVIKEIISVPGEKPKLIKETDKSLDFIKRNRLYHVTDLTKENIA